MTGHGDVPMAVEAMRIGAFDFVEKPFEPDRLADLCQRGGEARARTLETRALRRELSDGSVMIRRLMGASPAVEKLRETILDVAQADGHVLVAGRDRHRQEPDRHGAARLRSARGQAASSP